MNIEDQLKTLTADFDPYFHSRVIAKLANPVVLRRQILKRILIPSVAVLGLLICVVYIQDGSLSLDSVLGISDVDTQLNDYLIYY